MAENLFQVPYMKDQIVEEMKVNSALKYRVIYMAEDVDDDSVFKLNYYLDRILRLDEKCDTKEPITIIISSFGGSVYEILSSISRLEKMQEDGYIIKTIVDAKAMSCGSLLSQCGSKGYRYANRYATLLYHQVSSATWGTLAEMEVGTEETQRLWRLLKQITLKHTKVTDEWFESLKDRNRDLYLTPEQCLELGIIDHIL